MSPEPSTGMRNDVQVLPHVTIQENVYFQPVRDQPKAPASTYYTFHTEPETDPYERTSVKVYKEIRLLETGWVSNPSILWVQSLEATDRNTVPTPEEMRKHNSRVIELFVEADGKYRKFARIRPGHSIRFEPTDDIFIALATDAIGDELVRVMVAALPTCVPPSTIYPAPSAEGVVVDSGSVVSKG